MPEPPQLRHCLRPDPEQVPQPTSPSDQRLQRHSSRPVPLHVEQRGRASHLEAAGRPSVRFAMAKPASIPSPADAITIGPTIFAAPRTSLSPALRSLACYWMEMEMHQARRMRMKMRRRMRSCFLAVYAAGLVLVGVEKDLSVCVAGR